jgi:hypothetical protein
MKFSSWIIGAIVIVCIIGSLWIAVYGSNGYAVIQQVYGCDIDKVKVTTSVYKSSFGSKYDYRVLQFDCGCAVMDSLPVLKNVGLLQAEQFIIRLKKYNQ